MPKNPGVNYIGLIIGPQGHYQKRLEEESDCKILIRGKGSQKQGAPPQPDDAEDQHVLLIGDNWDQINKARGFVERILKSDQATRDKIRKEQLGVAALLGNDSRKDQQTGNISELYKQIGMENAQNDDTMMTPYGPPSNKAFIVPVPDDVVGLIIGKSGETIRQLQSESGAKIQVALKAMPENNMRRVFVEGPDDNFAAAKDMIEQIVVA